MILQNKYIEHVSYQFAHTAGPNAQCGLLHVVQRVHKERQWEGSSALDTRYRYHGCRVYDWRDSRSAL